MVWLLSSSQQTQIRLLCSPFFSLDCNSPIRGKECGLDGLLLNTGPCAHCHIAPGATHQPLSEVALLAGAAAIVGDDGAGSVPGVAELLTQPVALWLAHTRTSLSEGVAPTRCRYACQDGTLSK